MFFVIVFSKIMMFLQGATIAVGGVFLLVLLTGYVLFFHINPFVPHSLDAAAKQAYQDIKNYPEYTLPYPGEFICNVYYPGGGSELGNEISPKIIKLYYFHQDVSFTLSANLDKYTKSLTSSGWYSYSSDPALFETFFKNPHKDYTIDISVFNINSIDNVIRQQCNAELTALPLSDVFNTYIIGVTFLHPSQFVW